MSRIKSMTASLGTAALITAGVAVMSPGAAHAASGAAVSVWETTADQEPAADAAGGGGVQCRERVREPDDHD